jgi:hypothetical protein
MERGTFFRSSVSARPVATIGKRIHEGMCWGAAATEKNGATASKNRP